jgi:EGF-like domain
MCVAMNACGENGECQGNGQCVCNAGWAGADCSQKAQLLTAFFSKQYNINGTQHVLFEYREGIYQGERWEMTISSTQPLDLYLNGISTQDAEYIEPSEFDYVAAMKQQSYL